MPNSPRIITREAILDIPGALLHYVPLKGHLRSHYDVIGSPYTYFLPITFDRYELETWSWCHSVRLGTSTDLQHDLLKSHCDLDLA